MKTRKYRSLVSGAEAVGYKKKGRIIATADIFLADYDTDKTIRYDIADVTVSSGTAVRVIDFKSTRDVKVNVPSAYAISQGLSADGGLFVPENLPKLSEEKIMSLCDMSYA